MFREARQNRVFQDVVSQIQEAILDGRLKPGDKLPPEREMVEMFKTSRSTLREALRILEHKGLIEIKLGVSGGAMVKSTSGEQMSESLALLLRSQAVSLDHLAEFRRGVEGLVTALAAERATADDIRHLGELLAEAGSYCERPLTHRNDFIRVDEKLHMALARITGNPLYILILQTVHDNIHRYYDRYLAMEEHELKENYEDLCAIVRAVQDKLPGRARMLAEDHVGRFNGYMKKGESLLGPKT
ncbi:MAG: FadR/GntR family transcriptional regulator [Acidobacteriota bacterium]